MTSKDQRRMITNIPHSNLRRAAVGVAVATFVCLALLCTAVSAAASTTETWLPAFTFDGSDTIAGALSSPSGSIAVDQPTGIVYVLDLQKGVVDKFNQNGEAESFSATGESSLDPYPGVGSLDDWSGIAVDSYGPNPGRIYVVSKGDNVKAFEPSGELAWELSGVTGVDVAVDTQGRLLLGYNDLNLISGVVDTYASAGSPPVRLSTVAQQFWLDDVDVSADGVLYYKGSGSGNPFAGYLFRVEGTKSRNVNGEFHDESYDIAVDQSISNGHLYGLRDLDEGTCCQPNGFGEYDLNGDLIEEGFGREEIKSGGRIAYSAPLQRVYVVNSGEVIAYHKVTVTTPDVTLEPVSGITPTSATFSGTINPLGVNNSYRFEWRKQDRSWSEAASSPEEILPADEATHPVSYEATGLAAGTTYEVRLVAENTDLGVKAISNQRAFSNIPIKVQTIPASPRGDTTARINARVEPASNPATVRFELSEDGGATWATLPDHQVEEGIGGTLVIGENLTGLKPDTTYVYRAFAESELGPASPQGGEVSFTTRSSAEMQLPQRGIELVNSPDKGNANAIVGKAPMSPDGERALWFGGGEMPGEQGGDRSFYLAERTANGWISKSLIPPPSEQIGGGQWEYRMDDATRDLSGFIVSAGASFNGEHTFARVTSDQDHEVLGSLGETFNLDLDITDDAAHVLVIDRVSKQLLDIGDGSPEIVSLMPDGSPSTCGVESEGTGFPGYIAAQEDYPAMATGDASRVYFAVKPNGKCGALRALYVRNRKTGITTQIDPGASGIAATLIRATPDGRAAYFASAKKLDPADSNNGIDIYRWDEEAAASTCLTCVVPNANVRINTSSASSDDVLVSDDFSHIYFASKNQLVPGQGRAGDVNVYALSGGQIRFVADPDVDGVLLDRRAKLSADGEVLLMEVRSNRSMTADPIAAECPAFEGNGTLPCRELYRYDDNDGSLECLSCTHTGTTTHSDGVALGGGVRAGNFQMSSDGATVAFVTAEALLASDVNRGFDIYEWRNGGLGLITDGISSFPVGLSSPKVHAIEGGGRDMLFSLADPGLTGFERDSLVNLYDARIGGGFVLPSPLAHCFEESCQGPLQAAPSPDQRASSVPSRGNPHPPRPCRKGKVRRHGHCVKKRHRHRHHRHQAPHRTSQRSSK